MYVKIDALANSFCRFMTVIANIYMRVFTMDKGQ